MYNLDMSDARQFETGNTSGWEDEWLEWYRLTPLERWRESAYWLPLKAELERLRHDR